MSSARNMGEIMELWEGVVDNDVKPPVLTDEEKVVLAKGVLVARKERDGIRPNFIFGFTEGQEKRRRQLKLLSDGACSYLSSALAPGDSLFVPQPEVEAFIANQKDTGRGLGFDLKSLLRAG